MIKVIGIDYRTVALPDLSDRVYYGQFKTFTKNQVISSDSLKIAISQKRLSIEESSEEILQILKQPIAKPYKEPIVVSEKPKETEVVSTEKSIPVKEETTPVEIVLPSKDQGTINLLNELVTKVTNLEASVSNQGTKTVNAVQESISRVEKTVSGLSISGQGVTPVNASSHPPKGYKEEVFVPSSINVTDVTNNLRLETKQIGQGDSVRNSLSKLRALKNQKT
jgi:hypothetical protein